MDEWNVVGRDLAEMLALVATMRRDLATLSSSMTAPEQVNVLRTLYQSAASLTELSLRCHAEGCVRLASGLAGIFGSQPTSSALTEQQLTVVADLLVRLEQEAMELSPALHREDGWVAGPDELIDEGDDPVETLAELAQEHTHVSGHTLDGYDEGLTDDELALVQSFQMQPLRTSQGTGFDRSHHGDTRPEDSDTDAPRVERAQAAGPLSLAGASSSRYVVPGPELTRMPVRPAPTAEELDYIPPEMKRLFAVETTDDLQDLRITLLRYEQRADDAAALSAMGRIAHKIRGTASTLGFDVLATLVFLFEDVVKALQTRQVEAGPQATAALVRGLVLLQRALDAAAAEQEADPALVERARELHDDLLGARSTSTTPVSVGQHHNPATPPHPSAVSSKEMEVSESSARLPRSAESESLLRVDVRRLDELMNHIGALAVNRAAMMQARDGIVRLQTEIDQSLSRLTELTGQITDLHPLVHTGMSGGIGSGEEVSRATSGMPPKRPGPFGGLRLGRTEHADHSSADGQPHWDELELERYTEFDHALRVLSEVIADLGTTSRSLRLDLNRMTQLSEEQAGLATHVQRDVMHIRLVPLSDLMPRLHIEAQSLGPAIGKSVTFTVRGEKTQIDRNISEALTEPLIQLVRNAIVHGIEPVEERLERGKAAVGAVWMHAYYVGSEVIIEIGDDGQGVNPHRLAASAVAVGAVDAAAARALAPQEALDLMFVPGITTFDEAQVIGGRGVGLDEVRTAIQRLKGSIHVRSEVGQGSIFRIRVPISLSIVRSLHVRASGQHYALPFSSVLRTVTLSPFDIIATAPIAETGTGAPVGLTSTSGQRIRIERERGEGAAEQLYDEIPLFALAELLGFERERREIETAIVVEAGRQRVALLVDEVLDDQEVVVQALPRHLRRRSVRGATVMPDGQLLLLLDLPELVSDVLARTRTRPLPQPRPMPRLTQTLAPRVLVVDDSVSIRRTLELTLSRANFEVQLAHDGIEALEMMLVRLPRVVVLDIEMPRLDGFELLSILRTSPQFASVRVVMLTSRAAEKHREHALSLGAQAYLIKPCPQETLVETVRSLLGEPVEIR